MEFQFGDWLVSPEANIVSNGDAKTQLEPRVMAVLRYLCRHPGAVIPAEEILQACWGSNELGDNPVHKAITQLRRAFGDSSTEPRYIETIRKRGYRAIAPVVTFAAPPSTTWEGGSPFRGLEAFQENHAAIFFGRVQATAQLRELVMNQAAHGYPMALVLGPSGSGKTSLVRAGLLPQLMAPATRSDEPIGLVSTVYLDCADLGSGTLFQALAGALIDADINGEPLFPGASADSLGQRLATDPEGVATDLHKRTCSRAQVGVFVDRFEAVFRADADEANHFITAIDALAKSNCLLMLMACRNDFYPEVMAQPVLLALKTRGAHFDVLPPDGADIAQIVRQPALAANLTFDKDESTGASLDDVLCDAARGNHDMLPLLQYTLNELYRQRDEDGQLKFEVYRQLGGIEGAVGVRAEQVVAKLTASQIAALPHVLSLLVNIGEDQASVTTRRSPLGMLRTDDERDLVRVMIEARLFVSELAGDVPSFGVAHEALLRQWPRVVEWIEQYRNALQLRTRIESQAIRWEAVGRVRDLLLPQGSQVTQAAELLKLPDFALTQQATEYVRTSLNRAKFGERIRIGVTALIGILAVLAGALGIAARGAQKDAEQRRADAEGLLTFMLGEFVDKLRPVGRLELLDDVSAKALTYLATSRNDLGSGAIVQRAKALHLIHEVNSTRGKNEPALEALQAARQLLRQGNWEQSTDPMYLRQLALNGFWFGSLHLRRNELELADTMMSEYVKYADRYATVVPNDVDAWLEQSYAHNSLGTVALKRQDFKRAATEFNLSLQLKQKAKERRPNNASLLADLANSYSWLAESKLKLGDLSEAMRLYQEEEKQLRAIHAGNALWTYRLGLSLMRQSSLWQARGDQESALASIHNASDLLQKIVSQDPSNRTWLSRLYLTQIREVELQNPTDGTAAKLARLSRVVANLTDLSVKDPNNTYLALLVAKGRQVQTPLLLSLRRPDEARANLDEAIAPLSALNSSSTKDASYATTLGDLFLTRAEVALALGDKNAAASDCKNANSLMDRYVQSATDYSALAITVRANICEGKQDVVSSQIATLSQMGYKDPRYLQYVNSHQPKKGMQ